VSQPGYGPAYNNEALQTIYNFCYWFFVCVSTRSSCAIVPNRQQTNICSSYVDATWQLLQFK